jgi:hypothetical protein
MVSYLSAVVDHPNVVLTMMWPMIVSLMIVVLEAVAIVLVVRHDAFFLSFLWGYSP